METLRNLGADDRLIARIFLFEGRMISVFGALSGIVLGLSVSYTHLLRVFGIPVWLAGLGGIMWAFSSYFFILISAGHLSLIHIFAQTCKQSVSKPSMIWWRGMRVWRKSFFPCVTD